MIVNNNKIKNVNFIKKKKRTNNLIKKIERKFQLFERCIS